MDLSDLTDLENLENLEQIERRRNVSEERSECDLDILDESDFKARYRLSKETVECIVEMLQHKIESRSMKRNRLTSSEKVCLSLRYFATGSFQSVIGDLGDVSQATASRTIAQVAKCLAELRPTYIKLPQSELERREVSQKFYAMSGFPSVFGAVDCTHIPIMNPGGPSAERYRCRKGYFSLNVQTVCDAQLFIRDIVARWPGSTHDSTIFDNSRLRAVLETDVPATYHVLGDNGYGCRSYLLTPFLEPSTDSQRRYNAAHIKARNTVERQYGLLKRRFSCLGKPLRGSVDNSLTTIVATSVLHNIALSNSDNFTELEDQDETYQDVQNFHINEIAGVAKRNAIVNTFFTD